MTETPDDLFADLMRQAQAGDGVAYERLLRTIAPLIRSFFSRRIASPHDVDDILQNTLVAIHKASHTYNTNRSFTGWMFAIARYKLNDFLREHYRKRDVLDHSIDDEELNTEYYVTTLPTSSEVLTELRLWGSLFWGVGNGFANGCGAGFWSGYRSWLALNFLLFSVMGLCARLAHLLL